MKQLDNSVRDNGLNDVISTGNLLVVCKSAPAAYTDAANLATDTPAGTKIAEVALVGSDYTLADRALGGREVIVAAKNGVAAQDDSAVGDDLHVVVLDTVNGVMKVVTDEITNQVISAGNPINIPSFRFYFGPAV